MEEEEKDEDKTIELAKDIALVEYYYKVRITGEYPIMKRFNQQENLLHAFDLDAKRFGLKSDG